MLLTRERDRLKLLLAVNNAVVAHLDLEELLAAVSASLRQVVAHDVSGIALYDPASDQLRAHVLGGGDRASAPYFARGVPIPFSGTTGGEAFTTGQPVFANKPDFARFHSDYARQIYEAGIRSGGSIPLIAHGRKLGVLGVASRREDAFTPDDIDLLCQVAHQIAIAVENSLNYNRAKHERDRFEMMLEVSNIVSASLDMRALLSATSAILRDRIHHDFAGLALYDDASQQFRFLALDKPPEYLGEGYLIPLEGTPDGLAFKTRQAVWRERLDLAEFPAPTIQQAYQAGLRSGCSVPLIARDRVIGVLGVGSNREASITQADAETLQFIANQIATAVENALNFARARQAEQEATRQSDRLRMVLRINNAVVAQLELEELLRVVSGSLREVLHHDTTGVALYDPENDKLRLVMTDFPEQMELVEQSYLVPLEGTVMGLAFTSGEPVFLDEFDLDRFPSEFTRRSYEAGLRSCGNVPLIAHGRKLGALGVASRRPGAFSAADMELLCQSAKQIAIAVENALNFERARAAEEQAKRESERRQLLLEINNALVSQLDLRSLVKTVSACLRKLSHHDIVGMALYDPESNQLRTYATDLPDNEPFWKEGQPIPLAGSLSGVAFTTGQPVFPARIDDERFQSDFSRRFRAAGFKSGGAVPLISHGRKLGTIGIASYSEVDFSADEIALLCQVANQVAIAVENALAYREIETLKNKLTEEKLYLEEEINTAYNFEEIIGRSPALTRLLKQVETVAPTDSTVLIQGETGTGKELIARAIHALSARRARTLVKLNCAAIPMGLIESELFGHEKGAFTGAIAQRIGRFELANKGTLFLDEVGEIPLELQSKLLRVLQEQEFERLGNTRTLQVDVRLVAATNRDLAQMAAEHRFRSDLYYRLNVFPITIPPLRERPEDIPLLVRFFAQKFARRMKKRIETIPAEAVAALQQYRWPGNIRELENFIERAVILTPGPVLQIPLSEIKLPAQPASNVAPVAIPAATIPADTSSDGSLEAIEREHILRVLRETDWTVGGSEGAAAKLGMKRTTLQSRMKKLGITRQS